MRFPRAIYDLSIHLLALGYLPKILYSILFKGKYRKRKWLGQNQFTLSKEKRPLIWVHAVSMGETRAIAPLVAKLMDHPKKPRVIISSLTETVHEEAKKILPAADNHSFLPFDLPYVIGPIVKKVCPDFILISETDFWLNFLYFSKKEGAKICLVNGKMSERSFRRYAFFSSFARSLFSQFDHFFLQSEEHADRFAKLGISKEKITVTGNLKMKSSFPHLSSSDRDQLKLRCGIEKEDIVLTIGSTHDPEEKIFLDLLPGLFDKIPRLKVLLVPRHPERFQEVERILEKRGLSFGSYSKSTLGKIMLIDQMGLLREVYQVSDVAFVGGSFTAKVGGHNIYEPLFYGVATLFGPHMKSQAEMKDLALRHACALETSQEKLTTHLEHLLLSHRNRQVLTQKASLLVKKMQEGESELLETLLKINVF